MSAVAQLDFPLRLRIVNSADPWDGIEITAHSDPLNALGSFVRYTLAGAVTYGYLVTRMATDVRGTPWGMGLLYDVDSDAAADAPRPHKALDRRFRQRAEVEFTYA